MRRQFGPLLYAVAWPWCKDAWMAACNLYYLDGRHVQGHPALWGAQAALGQACLGVGAVCRMIQQPGEDSEAAVAGSQSQVAIAWHLVCRVVERCWAFQAMTVPDVHICPQQQAFDMFSALCCRPGVVGLYKKLGFAADPEGIKGMVRCLSKPIDGFV